VVIKSIVHDKSETNNTVEVKIKLKEIYFEQGNVNPTKELLKHSKYKIDVHKNVSWHEDLWQMFILIYFINVQTMYMYIVCANNVYRSVPCENWVKNAK
jgi:hypothetical protein